MSSNLKVNTILPSVGSNIGIGTNGGELNVDGGCKVQVGTALTLGHSIGLQYATQNLHSEGFEINQINASGIITASHFYGNGANITGVLKNIVEDTSPQLGGDLASNSNDILMAANDRVVFGSDALRVKHTGSHADIENTTGNITIKNDSSSSTEQILIQAKGGEDSIKAIANGAVELYHDNSKKIETTANGAKFSSLLEIKPSTYTNIEDNSAYGLNIKHVNEKPINIATGGDYIQIYDLTSSKLYVRCEHDAGVKLYNNNNVRLETTNTGATITGNLAFPSGNGIDFSATSGTPSNGGEILDDYEEGNFTASLGGVSNWSSYSVTGQGHYVKIGKAVHINVCFTNVNLNNSASGSIIIFNLPFVPFVVGDCRGVSSNYMSHKVNHANDGMTHSFYIHPTYGFRGQITKDNTDWVSWDASNFTQTGVYLDFSATYFTAS